MAVTPTLTASKILPALVFRTRNAKANCRPRPHRMTRPLMALRCREKSHAVPRIAAIPSRPVSRPMNQPLKSTNDLENEFTFVRPAAGNAEGVFHQSSRFFQIVFGGVVQAAQ